MIRWLIVWKKKPKGVKCVERIPGRLYPLFIAWDSKRGRPLRITSEQEQDQEEREDANK